MPNIVYQPSFLQPSITKSISFVLPQASDAHSKTIDYFTKSNFRMISAPTDKKMVFRRGSLLSNMFTFNPLKWKSVIEIEIQGQEVQLQLNVNTFGQAPTHKELALWDDFLTNIEAFMSHSNVDYLQQNKAALKAVRKNNYRLLGWILVGVILAGIPATFLAIYTGIDSIAAIGSGIGALYFFNKKNTPK